MHALQQLLTCSSDVQEAHREEAQRRREVQAELFDLQGPVQVLCRMHNGAADHSDDEGAGTKTCFAEPYVPPATCCSPCPCHLMFEACSTIYVSSTTLADSSLNVHHPVAHHPVFARCHVTLRF